MEGLRNAILVSKQPRRPFISEKTQASTTASNFLHALLACGEERVACVATVIFSLFWRQRIGSRGARLVMVQNAVMVQTLFH